MVSFLNMPACLPRSCSDGKSQETAEEEGQVRPQQEPALLCLQGVVSGPGIGGRFLCGSSSSTDLKEAHRFLGKRIKNTGFSVSRATLVYRPVVPACWGHLPVSQRPGRLVAGLLRK